MLQANCSCFIVCEKQLQFYTFNSNIGETLNYLEQELISKLFNSANYSRDARPVANKSVAFTVTFDLAYSQLINLVSCIYKHKWNAA